MRKLIAPVFALLLVSTSLGAGAPGSAIDGLWFKVKVKAKGLAFGEFQPDPEKRSVSTTIFVNVALNDTVGDGGPIYTLSVWSEVARDVWAFVDADNVGAESGTGSDLYLFDTELQVMTPDGDSIRCESVLALLPSKTDESGAVIKAKFQSLGSRVTSGTLSDGAQFEGGATFKGSIVDILDLPFIPG